MVLEKKRKKFQCLFTLSLLSPFGKAQSPSLNKFQSPSPKIAFNAKFGPVVLEKKMKNVKSGQQWHYSVNGNHGQILIWEAHLSLWQRQVNKYMNLPMVTYGSLSVDPCGYTQYRCGPVESTPPSTNAALMWPWYLISIHTNVSKEKQNSQTVDSINTNTTYHKFNISKYTQKLCYLNVRVEIKSSVSQRTTLYIQ